jgi:hypothetical protein
LDPVRKERGQWFVEMEEKAFKEAREVRLREESQLKGKAKGKGDVKNDEPNENVDTADHKDGEQRSETDMKADAKDTAVNEAVVADILKPKFANFLLDLGNESAQRKAAEDESAKSKKKSGIPKPLPETYTRPTNFSASKWLWKLSPDIPGVRARVVCFPCIGNRYSPFVSN